MKTAVTIVRYSIIVLLIAAIVPSLYTRFFPALQLTAEASEVPIKPYPIVFFDLYTQRGGMGPGIPGGEFAPGENVALYVNMTSNGLPVENRIILFEIEGPANSCILTTVTNSSGIASATFMIPLDLAQDKVLGTWCVTAQTGLDMDTVGDTLNLEVLPIIHAPEFPTLTVLLLAFILTLAITIILKRKSRQLKVAADNLVQKADLTRLVSRNATL
ncbi:MAG: hypothetical protein ABSC91_05735 [Candidatus Bathyarchaeia archaeon]